MESPRLEQRLQGMSLEGTGPIFPGAAAVVCACTGGLGELTPFCPVTSASWDSHSGASGLGLMCTGGDVMGIGDSLTSICR